MTTPARAAEIERAVDLGMRFQEAIHELDANLGNVYDAAIIILLNAAAQMVEADALTPEQFEKEVVGGLRIAMESRTEKKARKGAEQ
jgi:hypothetical protein